MKLQTECPEDLNDTLGVLLYLLNRYGRVELTRHEDHASGNVVDSITFGSDPPRGLGMQTHKHEFADATLDLERFKFRDMIAGSVDSIARVSTQEQREEIEENCQDCGALMDPGERRVFTVCGTCWDAAYSQEPSS